MMKTKPKQTDGRFDNLFDPSILDFNERNVPLESKVEELKINPSSEEKTPRCYGVDEIDLMAV